MGSWIWYAKPLLGVASLIGLTLALVSCGESPESWDKVAASAPGKFLVTQLPPGAKLVHVKDCNIESLDGSRITADKVVTIKRGSEIKITGWAADGVTKKAVQNLYVVIVQPQGAVLYAAKSGNRVNRQDVADYLKQPNPTGFGFESSGDTSAIQPGPYNLVVLSEQQKAFQMCDAGLKVEVAP